MVIDLYSSLNYILLNFFGRGGDNMPELIGYPTWFFTLQCGRCDSRDVDISIDKEGGTQYIMLKCNDCGNKEECY